MRIAMFGYQTWGHRTLRALLDSGHDVVLVVTHPKSDHAYEKIWNDSVADLAEQHGVPVLLRNRPDDEELLRALKEADPDLIVANNWRTWLPPEIFDLPTHGTLNIHDSLLPTYAGFSPLIWALINGEQEVGVTAHRMDGELDMGDVLLQRSVPVGPKDTATDLFHRTVDLIGPLVTDSLELIASGEAVWTPQDRSRSSFFHKRSLEDSRIDWTWPAEDLERFVRAQSDPYPNAFTHHRGERIRIVSASASEGRYGGTPGRIFIREGDGVVIVAGADARSGRLPGLVVERVRTEDGTEHAATDYFRTMGGYLTARP
ncbi:methionyl-tRNA formyltransferase [Streptomyces stelliscabiei]|uniref:Methionyl-tRNA formyltransferase n=1 Tax=Streptomyces stelliscabiei TaxID=146820 RepID=A0A8I0NZR6_9ACTN|nr:methionyl-tRNA formyltransferase [Streptomyces stelliscabiei]KND43229.1 methionyl-tRNA formyltransferase [Streptomyces stelliscabiei]MBE1594789.1 methionyl-tRNA formyltransferase [Streptomyces stelliscabiei]MDX2519070.1 methionyl-tRNA formyltransferase [Streptomyces stelliscabiei]MDX2550925.1 methionyl-tRNA formyltransferase [Streptomyces stelliscabiei]MDX2616593.1 methionyl-tRNA formyltransferase [Streptomyces stelliscabiei]